MTSKDELPKPLTNPLKSELIGEHQLRHTLTEEKVVLPSKDQIESERCQQKLFASIESFETKAALKSTETLEKNVLPTAADIAADKKEH